MKQALTTIFSTYNIKIKINTMKRSAVSEVNGRVMALQEFAPQSCWNKTSCYFQIQVYNDRNERLQVIQAWYYLVITLKLQLAAAL